MCAESRLFLVAALLACAVALNLQADDSETESEVDSKTSYYRDIRPIFQANCQGCHQPAKQGGEYVMTNFASLVAGGESGDAAIVPSNSGESNLVALVTPVDGKAEMPRGKKPLNEGEIALIRKWIAEGASDDSPVSTRPQYDMEHPPDYPAPPVITSLDYSSDGQWLAVSGYHEVVLHRADGSGVAARLVGQSERIESAVFSPDGKRLAVTGGSPGRMGELQIWDVEKRELKMSLAIGYDTIYGASWSHDGKLVAVGCPDTSVLAFDSETGEQELFNGAHDDWVLDTVFSVKSDHLITVGRDRSMKLIKVETQRFVDNITSITPGALKGGINAVDRHPTKDELLVGGADGVPKIYQMLRTRPRQIGDDFNLIQPVFSAMPGRIFDVKFSANGEQVVAGSSFDGIGHLHVYNVSDRKLITQVKIPQGGIFAVTFSHDGKQVASGGFDGYVRIHDATTGTLIKEFTPVEMAEVNGK